MGSSLLVCLKVFGLSEDESLQTHRGQASRRAKPFMKQSSKVQCHESGCWWQDMAPAAPVEWFGSRGLLVASPAGSGGGSSPVCILPRL